MLILGSGEEPFDLDRQRLRLNMTHFHQGIVQAGHLPNFRVRNPNSSRY
jgi:hypothetical protein